MQTKKTKTSIDASNVKEYKRIISIKPSKRSALDFSGVLDVVTIERHSFLYEISAELKHAAKECQHCGAADLSHHGRYIVRLQDLPYVDKLQRVMPVQYVINSQRYHCGTCGRGMVEPLPDVLQPVITGARITRRLSEWLLAELQTETSYETLATMTGYSKVWVRTWFKDVRELTGLPRKPFRPGPKKRD
jgi:hypothetical protein